VAKPFEHCPACATKLKEPGEDEERECPLCGRTWYVNSAPTAGAVITNDGRALITERGIEPFKGKFDIPGGFLRPGENPIDGLKRELREELQVEVDVSIEDLVQMHTHEYGEEGEWVLALGFVARLVSGTPTAGSDVSSARWVSLDELDTVEFAWAHDRDLVRKVLKTREGNGET
jgi:ADP-ribose pyrophosphatase YjhB (NUDIX family)